MGRSKPKVTVQVQIQEDTWTCHMWRVKAYEKMHGTDSSAITEPEDKTIHFKEDDFDMNVVGHELWHAFHKYLHIDSTNELNLATMEEILASFIGYNFIRFYEKAHVIYNTLKVGAKS